MSIKAFRNDTSLNACDDLLEWANTDALPERLLQKLRRIRVESP